MRSAIAVSAADGENPVDMPRAFRHRDELIDYLRSAFPTAVAVDDTIPATRGGRSVAERLLEAIEPARYAATRNYLDGAVTRLAPYLRHGVLSLAEVRDVALRKADTPQQAARLVSELGWRDYFQRVYRVLGLGIWRDLEPIKTGWSAADYADTLPADILAGETGLACIDAFSHALRTTGYLHNHARMWLAAYVVHFRRVRWQAGARWFLTHLLDGDPASNNLSWQWVASTFSHKPYMFNRENLEKYTGGIYCRVCALQGRCVFEGSYEQLTARLFPRLPTVKAPTSTVEALRKVEEHRSSGVKPVRLKKPIIWVHGDMLNPHSPAFQAFPGAPALWVWDDALLQRSPISLKRILFLYECLIELPAVIRRGDVAREVLRFAAEQRADGVVTVDSPSPGFRTRRRRIEQVLPVLALPALPFVKPAASLDLRRFARYWRNVEHLAMQPTLRSAFCDILNEVDSGGCF
jgi:deoxyribodipyrimidine photo-lyase